MSKFMHLQIKYHPSISLEKVKFVCYSVPSTNTSELITRIYAVDSLQYFHQSNLSKQEVKLKNLESFNTEAEKYTKKLK